MVDDNMIPLVLMIVVAVIHGIIVYRAAMNDDDPIDPSDDTYPPGFL